MLRSLFKLIKMVPRIPLYVFLGFFLSSPAIGASTPGEVVERIVAVVNQDIITLSELETAGKRFFDQVQQATLPSEREAKVQKAREEVLGQLIENKLLEQEIKNKKIEVSDHEVDLAIEDILTRNRIKENDLKKILAKDGVTLSTYRETIRLDIGRMRLINREIKSKIVIQDDAVWKKYQEKQAQFTDPVEVKVQQIFLAIPPRATKEEIRTLQQESQKILERAQKGEDFGVLARNYSQGPEARDDGVLGYFKARELKPELEESAFRLKPGELSEVIRTPEGFHILRLLERKGGEAKPFSEMKKTILDEMSQGEAERQFQVWLKNLKSKAHIEIRL